MELKWIRVCNIKPPEVPKSQRAMQKSLIEVGHVEPIKVRMITDPSYTYEIVYGRRRFMALKAIEGMTEIRCLVVDEMSDERLSIEALVENSGTPNPMDEACHMADLQVQGYTLEQIGRISGYSAGRISSTIKLLNLHDDVQEKVRKGQIGISAAQRLANLPKDVQLKVMSDNDKVTVKVANDAVSSYQSESLNLNLFNDEDFQSPSPGLYLTYEDMEELVSGPIEKEWNGNIIITLIMTNRRVI